MPNVDGHLTRAEIEAKDNWHGTYHCSNSNADYCLMRSIKGFYWHQSDYHGMFPSGATVSFAEWHLHLPDFVFVSGQRHPSQVKGVDMRAITYGQVAEVIRCAEVLAPLDNTGPAYMGKMLQAMSPAQQTEISQWITALRRVAREWNVTPIVPVTEKENQK